MDGGAREGGGRGAMKTGGSYNLFNGQEHLLASLASVRASLDHISLVVQTVSNLGHPADPDLMDIVAEALHRGLADEVIGYEPDLSLPAQANEHRKRSIGLERARERGVELFLTLDADEYYEPAKLAAARDRIEREGHGITLARTYLHIRRPIWRSAEPDSTCVCFLVRLTPQTRLTPGATYPLPIDPTRRISGSGTTAYLFEPDELAMLHMNLVRRDGLRSKLANTSSAALPGFVDAVAEACAVWRFGEPLRFPGKPPMDIVEVPDLFGIDPLFAGTSADA